MISYRVYPAIVGFFFILRVSNVLSFENLELSSEILRTLSELGYEVPSAIQKESIPVLMKNKDLIAQAQTGTGKTAGFALPILQNLNLKVESPQALILTPTRELAIQVAEAFNRYGKYLPGFKVMPIYGGQSFSLQLKQLKRGMHIVVGTPGRLMDHLRRGTLNTADVKTLVLDEADEMLNMGFIEDVKWIMEQISDKCQKALFSATMPEAIKAVAQKFMHKPVHIQIKAEKKQTENIEQSYVVVNREHKLEGITRYLEVEEFDALLIFTRTRSASVELADRLSARGFRTAALNGDMKQSVREQIITKLKKNQLDIVVATDVAARGIDVARISHVINYDIPFDSETYVHRIGRTGRAGRTGKSLLFITPRERGALRQLKKALPQNTFLEASIPDATDIKHAREEKFQSLVHKMLQKNSLPHYRKIFANLMLKNEVDELDVGAALIALWDKSRSLLSETKLSDINVKDKDKNQNPNSSKKVKRFKKSRRKKNPEA